jgi:hypothetical protein
MPESLRPADRSVMHAGKTGPVSCPASHPLTLGRPLMCMVTTTHLRALCIAENRELRKKVEDMKVALTTASAKEKHMLALQEEAVCSSPMSPRHPLPPTPNRVDADLALLVWTGATAATTHCKPGVRSAGPRASGARIVHTGVWFADEFCFSTHPVFVTFVFRPFACASGLVRDESGPSGAHPAGCDQCPER